MRYARANWPIRTGRLRRSVQNPEAISDSRVVVRVLAPYAVHVNERGRHAGFVERTSEHVRELIEPIIDAKFRKLL